MHTLVDACINFCNVVLNGTQIKYADGEEENLILLKESVKFKISCEEMQRLKLTTVKKEGLDYDEMLALAVAFGDCQELELGDIVWAKLTGLFGKYICY